MPALHKIQLLIAVFFLQNCGCWHSKIQRRVVLVVNLFNFLNLFFVVLLFLYLI